MRLILHTAAYWLLWRIQQAMPRTAALASAEFTTLRLRLLKVAARVVESASRIRIAFASACQDADLFRALVLRLKPAPPYPMRQRRHTPSPALKTDKPITPNAVKQTPARTALHPT